MQNLNYRILLDNQKTKRSKDNNGYLIVKDNPIALSGVFDYLLSEVSETDSDEVVKVCREFDDLTKNKDLFKDKPIIWEHTWTGEQGENQRADGAIIGDIEAKDGGLYADLIIYNSDLIRAIERGECYELSPGYEAEILSENGSYNGEHYDYKQLLQNVNHLAVVEQGRSGHELRIQDKKSIQGDLMEKKFTLKAIFDALKKVADEGEVVAEVETKDSEAVQDEPSNGEMVLKSIVEAIGKEDLSDDEKVEKIKEILSVGVVDECKTTDAPVAEVEVETKEPKDEGEIIAEVSADDIVKMIEKVTDEKVKKAISDYKSTAKILLDSIDEVKSVIGDFDTSGLNNTDEVYKKGFEIFTDSKLADGLDSKTAFKMEVAKRRPKTTIVDSASENDSGIQKLANRFK